MADISLNWNSDFQPSATGDLLLCSGVVQTEQRIIRRLLTAVRGYLWHPSYGAGLPQRIGRPAQISVITGIIKSQLMLESSIDPAQPTSVVVTTPANAVGLYVVQISFTARSGTQVSLSFDVGS